MVKLKKKNHFFLPRGGANIYLNKSYTNIFVTLADMRRKVIVCKSSGQSGIRGSKRRKIVPQAVESILKKLSAYFKLYEITSVSIIMKIKINVYFYYLLKELTYYNISVRGYSIRRPVAFNGTKGRKLRRR